MPDETPVTPVPTPEPPSIHGMKAQAQANVDFQFGTTSTSTNSAAQACIYAVKAILAKSVIDWGMPPDESLIEEAADRGIPVEMLCVAILQQARVEQARERKRTLAKLAIEAATTREGVVNAMMANSISFMNMQTFMS